MNEFTSVLIQTLNPDLIMGHELISVHLPAILEFMEKEQQLRLTKVKSKDVERSLNTPIKYRLKSVLAGRLLCDTYDLCKENLRIDNYESANFDFLMIRN